ncbi:MAG: histidine--tRNA ligase [Patescibacteria group bacterium]
MAKANYQSARGTKDILPPEQHYWQHVREISQKTLEGLSFDRIDTPHFENVEVFSRGIGQDTDIVKKEMFLLEKTSEKEETASYALRPEGTAGIVRSFVQNGMSSWPQPVRLYYFGSMFRHERPQKGRFREFYQLGVEIFGDETAKSDYLAIMSAWEILTRLGLKNLKVYTNSIGCPICRPKYIAKLKKYYKSNLKDLCEDCQERYDKNPLRLLDCKEEKCVKAAKGAPVILDSLCPECKKHFQDTLEYLDYFDIKYDLDHTLVRGLDYYTNTVFEIADKNDKSRQNVVGGGGRYNGLVELLGGPKTPAVGFSLGIERIVNLMKEQKIKVPAKRGVEVCILQLGDKAKSVSKKIYDSLSGNDINVYFVPSNDGLRQQIRMASKLGAKYAIIIGQKEALKDDLILRDLEASSQESFPKAAIVEAIKNRLKTCQCDKKVEGRE